jgi:hypothetical protein
MMHVTAQLRVTAPPTSATGTACERTPLHATQRAAWEPEEASTVRLRDEQRRQTTISIPKLSW